jgi:uncharacterized protein
MSLLTRKQKLKKHLKYICNCLGPLLVALSIVGFKVPPLTGPVMDLAGLLNVDDNYKLDHIIRDVNQLGKAQIQILTVNDLQGDVIENASIQVTDAWKLGSKKEDNGILLMVAKQEHKIRIEVGRGLEGDLPDIYAKRIIEDVMIPEFRNGHVSNGIVQGVLQILSKVAPDYLSQRNEQRDLETTQDVKSPASIGRIIHFIFIILSLFVIFILPRFPGSRRYYGGGFYGGGGGGFGGGGGWSGGGGGFSGGGSSGSW